MIEEGREGKADKVKELRSKESQEGWKKSGRQSEDTGGNEVTGNVVWSSDPLMSTTWDDL